MEKETNLMELQTITSGKVENSERKKKESNNRWEGLTVRKKVIWLIKKKKARKRIKERMRIREGLIFFRWTTHHCPYYSLIA